MLSIFAATCSFGHRDCVTMRLLLCFLQQVSALACTTICTTRKFFTIVYTATIKGNALTQEQWVGASLVMGGLVFDMATKQSKPKKKLQDAKAK